jgi:cysteine desulfurase
MRWIYLDYNATTPIAPSVQEAMLPYMAERYGNPSSNHVLGRMCQEAMEDARGQLALLLGADRDEIVFTSSGTEANNLALKGVMLKHAPSGGGHLVISALEHAAISEPAKFLERIGYDVTVVGCNSSGVVDPDAVAAALRPDTLLVSIMHANNEIGTIQPIRDIARTCHERAILVHTDAVQSIGKLRVNVDELEVDLLSVSGHKFYAPKGVGALFVRRGVALEPVLHGAGHEGGLRAGTENVTGIVALGRAAVLAAKSLKESSARLEELRDRLLDRLRAEIGDNLTVHGEYAERLPNTLSVCIADVSAEALLARIPELCAAAGSACHNTSVAISPTLAALGLDAAAARCTLRFSTGWFTNEDDIDRAANLVIAAWEDLR